MKTILCYGDSNTWGIDYTTGSRVPFSDRWPNVLQQQLGQDFHVIEEGLNGRTTASDDPSDTYPEAKNGTKQLIPCIRSHYPLDLFIIMLGTNDLKRAFFSTTAQIADSIAQMVTMSRQELLAKQHYEPQILLIAPPLLSDTLKLSPFAAAFDCDRAIAASGTLAKELHLRAKKLSCAYLNAADIVHANSVDAIHLPADQHHLLGQAVAKTINTLSF
jgi:lysophospholipase L1-like esterase